MYAKTVGDGRYLKNNFNFMRNVFQAECGGECL